MLTAYLSIFQGIRLTSSILALVACTSLIVQKRSSVARSIVFSFSFWLAPLFYISYIALEHKTSLAILLALAAETIILLAYLALFSRLLTAVSNKTLTDMPRLRQWLKNGTFAVIALELPLLLGGGFGIFSTGSRNDYIFDSKFSVYSAYASSLVQATMIPVIAAILNCEKRWNKYIVFYLVLISALSLLGGSKGGALLVIVAILSLLQFRKPRDYLALLRFPLAAVTVLFGLTVYYVGDFFVLDPLQMISLMGSRIFLTNDARALAIDLADPHRSLFRESFRLLSTLMGSPPVNPALGQYLYSVAFHTSGIVGANTSSTALLIAYGSDIEKALFCVVLCSLAVLIYFLTGNRGAFRVIRIAVGILLLGLLSQDFLAFQLNANLLGLWAFLAIGWSVGRRCLIAASRPRLSV